MRQGESLRHIRIFLKHPHLHGLLLGILYNLLLQSVPLIGDLPYLPFQFNNILLVPCEHVVFHLEVFVLVGQLFNLLAGVVVARGEVELVTVQVVMRI